MKTNASTISYLVYFYAICLYTHIIQCRDLHHSWMFLFFSVFQLLCTSAHDDEEIRALVKGQMSHRQALLASTYNINQFSIQCAITLLLQSWAFFLSRNCFVPCCLVASVLFGCVFVFCVCVFVCVCIKVLFNRPRPLYIINTIGV